MWGECSSGGGRAVSDAIGIEGGFRVDDGWRFDQIVAPNGYLWWYVDALSADGTHGLTIILFVGSVFSPYYKWRRRYGPVQAENHCAVNVVLFGAGGKRWSMTERGASSLRRSADRYCLGASHAQLEAGRLTIVVDEIGVPFPHRIKGKIIVSFDALQTTAFHLDSHHKHVWRPLAPRAHIQVAFDSPRQSWEGEAYVDSNWGAEPVESGFLGWQWSRASRNEETCVFYDVVERPGTKRGIAAAFDRKGGVRPLPAAPQHDAGKTLWRVERPYRSEGLHSGVIKTVEDTPFYARSLLKQTIEGQDCTAIHESLDVTRYERPIVQAMLPWRMPRRDLAPR